MIRLLVRQNQKLLNGVKSCFQEMREQTKVFENGQAKLHSELAELKTTLLAQGATATSAGTITSALEPIVECVSNVPWPFKEDADVRQCFSSQTFTALLRHQIHDIDVLPDDRDCKQYLNQVFFNSY